MTEVLFRVDGTPAIGTGHVMRCVAIAEALHDQGARCAWLAARLTDALARRIEAEGIALEVIEAAPGDPRDLRATIARAGTADALVIDNYHFDAAYRAAVRPACRRILALDDLATEPALHADIVVNASDGAADLPYDRIAPGAVRLFGASHAAIRRDIRAAAARAAPISERRRVLLTFGGSDPLGLTAPVLTALAPGLPPDLVLTALVGGSTPNPEAVIAAAAPFGARVSVVIDASSVGALMAESGLAVSAAGSTIGELAAVGVPTLAVVIADNQEAGTRAAVARGTCRAIDGRVAGAVDRIAEAALALWADEAGRAALAESARSVVDGRGAIRIARALLAQP